MRTGETESEDAKSTGSWSIYSDSPKNGPRAASNNSLTGVAAAGATSAASVSVSDDDVAALLTKIENLQTDKFGLEQKTQMLEASASAMADELVRKSEIITHYCMEGKHLNGENIKMMVAPRVALLHVKWISLKIAQKFLFQA